MIDLPGASVIAFTKVNFYTPKKIKLGRELRK